MIVTRIGAWSMGRIYGAISAAFGLLIGLVFAAVSIAGSSLRATDDIPAGFGALFGIGAVVLMPVCYGLLGLLAGALTAALYNLFAGMVGGVELEMK